jgi:phytoene dehydrogenase-like protein
MRAIRREDLLMEEKHDAIVVGAGFGGSACAALLARRGLKTLLLDKNAVAGGKALTMSKEGFRYELWPVVGGPSLNSQFHAVLKDLDMEDEVELLTPPGIGGLLYKGRSGRYEAPPSPAEQQEEEGPLALVRLLGLTQEELPEAARLFGDMTSMPPEEIEKLDDVTLSEFLSRYQVPRPVYSYLGMWSNIVFVVPIDLLAASEAIKTHQDFARGGAMRYSSGGYGRVAEVFAQAVERYGGRVLMKTRVERIMVEESAVSGVVTDQGIFRAPIVVSNAGIQPTVLRLVGEQHFDKGYVAYVKGLLPSWGIMGIRYFLSRPVFDRGVYITFSDDSYLDTERFLKAKAGQMPEDVIVFVVVPSLYDSTLAPEGKQCALVGTLCSPDPEAPDAEMWWNKLEEMVYKLWPDVEQCTESKERYSCYHVSALTRDHVLPGQGGECIGLAQIVGQCGRHKPLARAPIRGLFYVGCDAGGYGCGTHQAVDSGVNVAAMVEREHRVRASMF